MLSEDKGCAFCHPLPAAFPWSCLGHISVLALPEVPQGAEPGLNGWAVSPYYYTFGSWVCSSASVPLETVLQSLHVKVFPPQLWDALEFSEVFQLWSAGKVVEISHHWHDDFFAELMWASPNNSKPQALWLIAHPYQKEFGQWCHEDVGIRCISFTSSVEDTLSNSWYRDWKQVMTT